MRRVGAGAFTILLVSGILQFESIRRESQTVDEGVHLSAGYVYWRTGDLSWNREHPPLAKYLNALPLLWLNPLLPAMEVNGQRREPYEFGSEFLYKNIVPAEAMLLAARFVTILLTAALGISVLIFVRSAAGDVAGLAAMALILFEPNIMAHGRYITSDLPLTLFAFLACISWIQFLEARKWKWCWAAGIFLGAALASKFSGIIFLAVLLVMAGAHMISRRSFCWRILGGFALVCLLTNLAVASVYSAEGPLLIPGIRLLQPDLPRMASSYGITPTAKAILYVGHRLALADSTWFHGLADLADHNRTGHEAYLFGQYRQDGWWYYFPAAFLIKSSAGLLIAIGAATWAWFRSGSHSKMLIAQLAIPATLFLVIAMSSTINIGVRHILPVYPFLASAATILLAERLPKAILISCVVLVFTECLLIYPHYLSFFNVFSGGPSRGYQYLLDSNIDWGQDATRLQSYVKEQGIDHICASYFGGVELSYFGINNVGIPESESEQTNLNCLAVLSVTTLYGLYDGRGRFDWFRKREPDARIGYSINVYDLRHR